jgi:hypothetical protein
LTAEFGGEVDGRGATGGVVEGGGQVTFGLQGDGVAEVDFAAD